MDCSKPDFPVHHCLPEFVQTLSHWVSDSIQPSCPLSSLSPPAFNLSQHQSLFQWVSPLHQVAKYWNFSSHISPSNKYSGWISFRIDWFDLLAVQGTLKSLLQYHSLKASVLQHSTFFIRIKLLQPFQSLTSCSLNSLGIRERIHSQFHLVSQIDPLCFPANDYWLFGILFIIKYNRICLPPLSLTQVPIPCDSYGYCLVFW